MPDTVFINVPPNFNLHMFAGQLAEKYRMEGFTVTVADFNNTVVITFDKNTGGINMLLGLGEGIKATCMVANGVLSINFPKTPSGSLQRHRSGWPRSGTGRARSPGGAGCGPALR